MRRPGRRRRAGLTPARHGGARQQRGGGRSAVRPQRRIPARCRCRFGHAAHRQQPGRSAPQQRGRQQRQRVQIRRRAPQPPVQTAGRAVERPRGHDRHHLPRSDLVALGDQWAHRLVRGPQRWIARTRELDRQHPSSRDAARERDPAGSGREHRRPRSGGEVHPAVPPPVLRGGRLPPPYDHGPPRQRPDPFAVRRIHRDRRRHGCGRRLCRGRGGRPAAPHREKRSGGCRRGRPHQAPRPAARCAADHGPEPGSVPGRCVSHGTTVPRQTGSRGSWPGSVEYRPVVDSAVTRHSTGPVHFLWRSGSPGRLRTPRHLLLNGGGRAPRSLVARRVGASGATANLRSR
ncbi:hypothetical protein EES39_20870 [Streptomyces sp. ADI92-24]|nr:hypothetical protein EES39_20870 [Streptomyces sp. ADI92-24]